MLINHSYAFVFFRAGSRNEPVGKEGVVHMIRVASSLTNKNSTQFALARTINQAGASLSCTAGREHIMYSVDVNRQQLYNKYKLLTTFIKLNYNNTFFFSFL